MDYINYTYYHDTFGGNLIPQNKFDRYATEASNKVRVRIMNRDITGNETAVKNATCFVAEFLYNQEAKEDKIKSIIDGSGHILTSEKVGDYSRNFSSASISDIQAQLDRTDSEIDKILEENLLFTGLLNRGMSCV